MTRNAAISTSFTSEAFFKTSSLHKYQEANGYEQIIMNEVPYSVVRAAELAAISIVSSSLDVTFTASSSSFVSAAWNDQKIWQWDIQNDEPTNVYK